MRPVVPLAVLAALAAPLAPLAQDLPLQGFVLQSKTLGQERRILVWTPPGYERGDRRYPVLYLTDGSRQLPLVATTARFLAEHGRVPDLIVVGIDPVDRTHELTPTPGGIEGLELDTRTAGGADSFLAFLEGELIPWVEARYRTEPFRILAGHSFGGLFALHTLHVRPELFQARIAVAPSLLWNGGEPVKRTREFLSKHPEATGTLVVTLGDEGSWVAKRFDELRKVMKGAGPGLRFTALRFPGEDHGTVVFESHYKALEAVFDGWQMPVAEGATGPRGGIAAVKAHYEALSSRLGWKVLPPENVVNLAGYQLVRERDFDQAILTLQQNVAWYPDSANVHDSLGEAYEAAGRMGDAQREYQAAWEAGEKRKDPNTPAYKEHLDRVTGKLAGS